MTKWLYLIMLFLILGDVSFFIESSDFRIFAIIIVYIYFLKRFTLRSNMTFIFALILLLATYVQFIFITPDMLTSTTIQYSAEKTAVWVYIFLIIGIIQKLIEYKKIKNVL